ncbi:MAG: hypothetical protein K2M11_05620 [Paramuribaculum sp.]|nr:hypothetical protein [Paramuribaculum sp.]
MSVQGISFYDFLGKFIPGALLLLLFDSNLLKVKLDSPEILFWIAAAYLLGILWDKVIRFISPCLTRNDWMLIRSRKKHTTFIERIGGTCYMQDEQSIQFAYDKAYSLLMLHNMLGTVPKQESHENFLRNIFLIIVFFLIKTVIGTCQCCCVNLWNTILQLSLIALIIVVPFLWYSIQMSIYFTVWDNAYWTQYHISKKEENK